MKSGYPACSFYNIVINLAIGSCVIMLSICCIVPNLLKMAEAVKIIVSGKFFFNVSLKGLIVVLLTL